MSQPRRKSRKNRPARGVLMIIAFLLVGSALLRAGLGAGQAIAENDVTDRSVSNGPMTCETPADLAGVLAALQSREQRLDMREEQIRARMQALTLADRELEEKLSSLAAAEERLRATMALADTAAEDDIARLVSVYEAMKAKEAALLFEEMSPEFAAGFLGRMRPEAAAGVLANLTPQAAYSLSVILAGRNALVPQN